jgi:hypothetical protein
LGKLRIDESVPTPAPRGDALIHHAGSWMRNRRVIGAVTELGRELGFDIVAEALRRKLKETPSGP